MVLIGRQVKRVILEKKAIQSHSESAQHSVSMAYFERDWLLGQVWLKRVNQFITNKGGPCEPQIAFLF